MIQIAGAEFTRLIIENPSWCKDLRKPLEVVTYVNLESSKITHLSPLITFSGINNLGWAADFHNCKHLKIATGTFYGPTDFNNSGVEKIENLTVTDSEIYSTNFSNCKNLKVATGTFEGFVNFAGSGIETIKDLIIKNQDSDGHKAYFTTCPIVHVPKAYRNKEFIFDEGIIENSILRDKTIEKIKSEASLIEL